MGDKRERVLYVLLICSENVDKAQLQKIKRRLGRTNEKNFNCSSYHSGGGLLILLFWDCCVCKVDKGKE